MENIVNIVTRQKGKSLARIKLDHQGYNAVWNSSLPFSDIPVIPDSSRQLAANENHVVGYYGNGYLEQIFFHVDSCYWDTRNFKILYWQ